jgi:hypothetical protein
LALRSGIEEAVLRDAQLPFGSVSTTRRVLYWRTFLSCSEFGAPPHSAFRAGIAQSVEVGWSDSRSIPLDYRNRVAHSSRPYSPSFGAGLER